MTGEIGQLALVLALALSLVMAIAGLLGARRRPCHGAQRRRRRRHRAVRLRRAGLRRADLCLRHLGFPHPGRRAAIRNTAKPLIYKITGVWGNHEGSMLLWVLVLAIYSALIAGLQRGGARLTIGGAGRAGTAGGRVPALHSLHLQSVPAARSAAVRRRGPESAAAGSRPGHASADALRRLCRAVGGLLLCRRRAHHRRATQTGRARRGPSCWWPGSR